MLTKTTNDNYLDVNKLTPGNRVEVLAYLTGSSLRTAKNDKGFVVFYLRDVTGKTITGRQFEVEGYYDSGYIVSSMKKKAVLVEAVPDVFNNTLCLVVKKIRAWEGEFDYSRFLAKFENGEQTITKLNSLLESVGVENAFDTTYVNTSYLSICDGLSGGYIKVLQMMVNAVTAYNGCPGIDTKEILYCMAKVVNVYANILELRETMDITLVNAEMDMIYTGLRDVTDERLRNICSDALFAAVRGTTAQHLYAHIISDSLKTAIKNLSFCYQYPLVVKGSVKEVGDYQLSRY